MLPRVSSWEDETFLGLQPLLDRLQKDNRGASIQPVSNGWAVGYINADGTAGEVLAYGAEIQDAIASAIIAVEHIN